MSRRKKRKRLRREREAARAATERAIPTMSYYITAQAAIRYYFLAIQSGDREVGGYCKFHLDEKQNCIITELRPIKQESSECYFEIGAKENAMFLESLVAEGEDPKDWSMLFHTHPSGMSANMSGTDVKMLTEMANDLPGQVARSIILPQGDLHPMIHEAVQIEGRVFMRESGKVQILDTTNALSDLKAIGFFDQPKPKPVGFQQQGYTSQYGQGYTAAQRGNNRELVPLRPAGSTFHGQQPARNDGWFDEAPQQSEVRDYSKAASWADDEWGSGSWLDDEWEEKRKKELEEQAWAEADNHYDLLEATASDYIGATVIYNGSEIAVIDAYVHPDNDDVMLVLPDNRNISLAEVTQPQQEAQSA